MSTPMVATPMYRLGVRWTLRTITVAALLLNALLFGFEAISGGLDDISMPHVIISLIFAGIVALRLRWVPALGALLCAAQLVEGAIFLGSSLTEPDNHGVDPQRGRAGRGHGRSLIGTFRTRGVLLSRGRRW